MERTTEEFKMLIFDLMNGSLDLTNNPPEESGYVEDEYAEGKTCQQAYSKILDAYWRVCERLGVGEEDDDLEVIMDNFNLITKCLCMKMYDYCCFFTQPSIK